MMAAGGSRESKGQGSKSPAQLQHDTTLPAEGKDLAYGSAGKCGEMDLTDSIWTERAFLKMSAVQQEVLMGLREDR